MHLMSFHPIMFIELDETCGNIKQFNIINQFNGHAVPSYLTCALKCFENRVTKWQRDLS